LNFLAVFSFLHGVAEGSDNWYKSIWDIFTKPMSQKMLPDMPKAGNLVISH